MKLQDLIRLALDTSFDEGNTLDIKVYSQQFTSTGTMACAIVTAIDPDHSSATHYHYAIKYEQATTKLTTILIQQKSTP